MEEAFALASFHQHGAGASSPRVSLIEQSGRRGAAALAKVAIAASTTGLSVYDLADQTALSSVALGATFEAIAGPASRSAPKQAQTVRVKSQRTTYVSVKGESEETGQVLAFVEDERKDGSTDGEPLRRSHPVTSIVQAIAAPRGMPGYLLVASADGSFTVVNEVDFGSLATSTPTASSASYQSQSLSAAPVSCSSARFLPPSVAAVLPSIAGKTHAALLVRRHARAALPTKRKGKKAVTNDLDQPSTFTLSVLLVDPAVESGEGESFAGIADLGSTDLQARSVTVSEEGYVSIVDEEQILRSYRISFEDLPSTSYSQLFAPDATSAAPLLLEEVKATALKHVPAALVALHSSFVVFAVAATSGDSTKVALVLWDVRLAAAIAETTISVPSAVFPEGDAKEVDVRLTRLSRTHLAVSIAPRSAAAGGRSIVFAVPYDLPDQSELAMIVGKQHLTEQHAESTNAKAAEEQPRRSKRKSVAGDDPSQAPLGDAERSRLDLLEKVRASYQSPAGADAKQLANKADDAFAEWREREQRRLSVLDELPHRVVDMDIDQPDVAAPAPVAHRPVDKYHKAINRIERELKNAGKRADWEAVASERIKGVKDSYRLRYINDRKSGELEKQKEKRRARQGTEATSKESSKPRKTPKKALNGVTNGTHNGVAHDVEAEPELPSHFVATLLRTCIGDAPADAKNVVLPPGMIDYCFERRALTDTMVDGGLTQRFLMAGDWAHVLEALSCFGDIAEANIVAALKTSLSSKSTAGVTLDDLLPPVLRSSYDPVALRAQAQKQLEGHEVTEILTVLDKWIALWTPSLAEASGATVDTPAGLDETLKFIVTLLDSHFVPLLLDRAAHPALTQLAEHVAEQVESSLLLSSLLSPLSIYDEASAKASRKQVSAARHVDAGNARSAAPGRVGRGKLDRERFKKSMERRAHAEEQHAQIGDYAVEILAL